MNETLSTLAAMLGGGFQGYAKDQDTRFQNARQLEAEALERARFNEQVSQFNRNFKQNQTEQNRRFTLDDALGRGNLAVNQGGLDVSRRRMMHDSAFDWARLDQEAAENAKNRANELEKANLYVEAGRGGMPGPKDREAIGDTYIRMWARTPELDSTATTAAGGLPTGGTGNRNLQDAAAMSALLNISLQEAAYRVAQREKGPGGSLYYDRPDDQSGAGGGALPAWRPGTDTQTTRPDTTARRTVPPAATQPNFSADNPFAPTKRP